eukprot:scaffold118880_cov37-Phaeocystis_antarctica.AAC.2
MTGKNCMAFCTVGCANHGALSLPKPACSKPSAPIVGASARTESAIAESAASESAMGAAGQTSRRAASGVLRVEVGQLRGVAERRLYATLQIFSGHNKILSRELLGTCVSPEQPGPCEGLHRPVCPHANIHGGGAAAAAAAATQRAAPRSRTPLQGWLHFLGSSSIRSRRSSGST